MAQLRGRVNQKIRVTWQWRKHRNLIPTGTSVLEQFMKQHRLEFERAPVQKAFRIADESGLLNHRQIQDRQDTRFIDSIQGLVTEVLCKSKANRTPSSRRRGSIQSIFNNEELLQVCLP